MKNKILIGIICFLVIVCTVLATLLIVKTNEDDDYSKPKRSKTTTNTLTNTTTTSTSTSGHNHCSHNNPNKIMVLDAKEPTCQEYGLTEGKKCLQCGEIIVPQYDIEKLECIESDWIIDLNATESSEGYKHTECIVCGRMISNGIIPIDISITYELSILELVDFVNELDGDVGDINQDTVRYLQALVAIRTILTGNHTTDEMYTLISTGALQNSGFTKFQIEQMYGLYLWEEFNHDAVSFEVIIDFVAEMARDEHFRGMMGEETAEDIIDLSKGLKEFKRQMNTYVTKEEFLQFGRDQFGEAAWIDLACGSVFALCNKNSDGEARIVDIFKLVDMVSNLIPEDFAKLIRNYTYVYDAIDDECAPEDFIPMLKMVVLALTGEERDIYVSENAIQQVYIMYFREQGAIPDSKINGFGFIQFVNQTIANNATVAGQLSPMCQEKLQDILIIKDFVSDMNKYDYKEMTTNLNDLSYRTGSIFASSGSSAQITEDQMRAIYILIEE